MGFLDRMVSDMIRRETGFNARRIVRRIGGKNILLLGGAAVAGGMLASQARDQSRTSTATSRRTTLPPTHSGGAPPPELPPLPQHGPDLPPLPSSGAEPAPATIAEEDIPSDLLYAIVRTMVAAALADGELSSEEKGTIDRRLAKSSLSEEQIAQVRRDLIVPASVEEIAAVLPKGEDPEVLAQFAVLVGRADGSHNELETAWLQSLAEALDIPSGRIDELTREIFAG